MIKRIVTLVSCFFITVGGAAPLYADDFDIEPIPRLRAEARDVQGLIDDGLSRSPAFRALVARLEAADVVVYVRFEQLPPRLDGQLTFVSAVAGLRYVIVRISRDLSPPRKIATLGHELQHAVEIAEQPAIVDQRTLEHTFRQIGFERDKRSHLVTAYDTTAAIETGEQIWKEVNGAAPMTY